MMSNTISNNSILDSRNRFYTGFNIVSTIALFALKEAVSLNLAAFTLGGLTTIATNFNIFELIATSSLSNKKKFIPLQIALIGLIVLGSSASNIILLSTGFSLSKILYGLITAKVALCIADIPFYIFILLFVSSPLTNLFKIIDLFKHQIIVHNRLLQELRPLNSVSYNGPLIQVTGLHCAELMITLIYEAVTRGVRDEIDTNENTFVFRNNEILGPYLIRSINESANPILNPFRFLQISEHLEEFPQQVEFGENRRESFQMLLIEFERLSIDLQKKYYNKILQYHDLQLIIPDNLRITLEKYQRENITLSTDLDTLITTGESFYKEMLEFTKKTQDLQTSYELKNIMIGYVSLQNSLRENLGRQLENTNDRTRITSLINSLYSLYENEMLRIYFKNFPEDFSNDDMDQPAWNYLAAKFPYDFFENLPGHLFSNTQDPDKLDQDFNKYKIGTAREFITKIFDNDIVVFRHCKKEQVIEKLIHYCTNNSPFNRHKIEYLKIQDQAYRIVNISTVIFASIIAPLLLNPIGFGIGAFVGAGVGILIRERTSLSSPIFYASLLSIFPTLGSLWIGYQLGRRSIDILIN